MELFLLYLWLKIDSVIVVLGAAAFVSTLILVFLVSNACTTCSWEDTYDAACEFKTKGWKKFAITPITCLLLAALLPSKTDIAVLVGGSYALDIAKSPEAAKLMTVIRGKANEILDEQIKCMNQKK